MANRIELLIQAQDRASGVIQKVGSSVGQLGTEMAGLSRFAGAGGPLGIALAATAGLSTATFKLASAFGNEVEELDNLAAASGATVQQLQIMRRVTENQGLSADTLVGSMRFLNRAIADQNPLLARLGINTRDAHEALLQLSDAFGRSRDAAAKNKIAMTLLGRSGSELISVLEGLRAKEADVAQQLGDGLFSEKMLEQGRKWDAEWDRISTRWEGFMKRIGGAAATAGNSIVDALGAATKFASGKGFPRFVPGMGAGMGAGVTSLGAAGPVDSNLAAALKDAPVDLARLASAYATFVEVRQRDLMISTTGRDLFSALLGLGEGAADPGTRFTAGAEESFDRLVTLSNSLANGFSDAFAVMTIGTREWADVTRSIVHNLVNDLIAEFNRMAATWVLRQILTFATGGLTAGAGGGMGFDPKALQATHPRTEAGSVTHYHINALDAASITQSMTNPLGGWRRAGDSVSFGASMA